MLAAEITAVTGRDPGWHYQQLAAKYGAPCYARIDAAATPGEKAAFKRLSRAAAGHQLAGDLITARLTHAPGNAAAIGGLKVVTANGWSLPRAPRARRTSTRSMPRASSTAHLQQILQEARQIVGEALRG